MFRIILFCSTLASLTFNGLAGQAADGLLPKQAIGVTDFLKNHPTADGRNVTIAIFDSGVDPGASGLRRTSAGEVKVIDMIDGTGSGDVEMTKTVRQADGFLEGATGRRLRAPDAWRAADRKFRVGVKRAFEFFPHSVIARMKKVLVKRLL